MTDIEKALASRTEAMYTANDAANRYKADADRLAEAIPNLLAAPDDASVREAAVEALRQHDPDDTALVTTASLAAATDAAQRRDPDLHRKGGKYAAAAIIAAAKEAER